MLLATACGQQSDDRVETTDTASSGSLQSEVAAATPFVTIDCTSLQAMPVDAPPASATTIGGASAIFQPNGAPAITIATDATPPPSSAWPTSPSARARRRRPATR